MNTDIAKRQTTLDEDLAAFPYINGELFAGHLRFPNFNAPMRRILLEACAFNWDAISPAIFGALFQSVMLPAQRRKQGAHYTTERNILKVIQPLFMDELRTEFDRLRTRRDTGRRRALEAFWEKLGKLTFFDPACGCGNFLIISYRELRGLEIDLLAVLYPLGQGELDVTILSKIDVDQFYGIEISEFPARIAEVALWMMDHIMNNRLSLAFGKSFLRIPLRTSPHILHADALETDWEAFLPAARCSYVFGNPPFVGQSYQSEIQRKQMAQVVGTKRGGSLDYVTAWFLRAGAYVQDNDVGIGFVATNSITQGEQVAQLWPMLFERYKLEIDFAHRTFPWGSDARGMAHVHVVIVGLRQKNQEERLRRLFSYPSPMADPVQSEHQAISPYLFAVAPTSAHLVVREARTSLSSAPPIRMGSKIVDGGYLIFTDAEKLAFLEAEPGAAMLFCPLMGSEEYINGGSRWILSLSTVSPTILRRLPKVVERIAAVKSFRLKSKKLKTRQLAEAPTQFEVTTIPFKAYLAIPEVSSERRKYVPIGWLEPPTIPSNLVQTVLGASL